MARKIASNAVEKTAFEHKKRLNSARFRLGNRVGQANLSTTLTGLMNDAALFGRWALSCSYDQTVKVWDWATGQERLTFTGHSDTVTGVALSGRWALSCSSDCTVKVWDWTTGQERLTFTDHTDRVTGVAFSGRWALSCSHDKTVKVWDIESGEERLTFTGHTRKAGQTVPL